MFYHSNTNLFLFTSNLLYAATNCYDNIDGTEGAPISSYAESWATVLIGLLKMKVNFFSKDIVFKETDYMWCIARFEMSHYLAFAWTFEHMQMPASAFFYLHVVFIRLHELAWHSNGSIKCQKLECHSNG